MVGQSSVCVGGGGGGECVCMCGFFSWERGRSFLLGAAGAVCEFGEASIPLERQPCLPGVG